MKKRILSLVVTFMIILSFGVYADDNSKYLKETKFTGWSQDSYYENGEMIVNSWINPKGLWYFIKTDGVKAKGWIQLNNNWYYFDSQGKMQTGWIKDINSKWYYLNSDGTMAHDTYIGSYYVGSDGAWIK